MACRRATPSPAPGQTPAIDRVAQRLTDLETDFVVLERFLSVRRNQHPDARIDVLPKLLRQLRVILVPSEVGSWDIHPVQLLLAFSALERKNGRIGGNDRQEGLLDVELLEVP